MSWVKLPGQAYNMLYVFGGNQVYLIFNARMFVKWNCCVSLWVGVVRLDLDGVKWALRESPRKMIQG